MLNIALEQKREIVSQLPPRWENNARDIVSNDIQRIMNMSDKKLATWILQKEYGMDLDYQVSDVGEEPNNE